MIAKKNKKFNLERKRFAFFQIGLLISGSLCLAAFEYTTVKPDSYTHVIEEETNGYAWEEPETEKEFNFLEDKPQPKVVYITDLQKIKIVDKFDKEGDPITTDNSDYVNMDGDGDATWDDFDWGIEDEYIEYDVVDKEPEFPGGEEAMFEFIKKNIQYPELPKQMGIQGLVYVHFVVSKSGAIKKITTSRAPHEDLAKEATRVVDMMPKWIPGEQAGKRVNVKYTLPIHFLQH